MRNLWIALAILIPLGAQAQQRDSVFASYDEYSTYVDRMIMNRDFIPFIQTMGGRDEYTPEQLAGVNRQLMSVFTVDFENSAVFRAEDLGGGMRREARVYWSGETYAFFYAMLHQRTDDLVVVNFNLNSSISDIMADF